MNTLFLHKLILSLPRRGVNIYIMIRKITLLLLLLAGLNSAVKAQVVLDSVSIFLPYGMDTTCPGVQLKFMAIQSNDTFSTAQYHWYTNTTYTGVTIDTFYTTALSDGDSVFCNLVYVNSLGDTDSFRSNTIIIHRSSSFAPRVAIALTAGRNPDCAGNAVTFTAYPVNGGSSPSFQWLVNGLPLPAEDSESITTVFAAGDTVSCQMISNSTCSFPFNDTVVSPGIVISHDSLNALISIVTTHNPICAGALDSFDATFSNAGIGASLVWYVDTTLIPLALGPRYITDSLHNGDLVYCVLRTPDPCVINDTTISNIITMTVIAPLPTSAWIVLTGGSNPGCLDSPVTFTGHYLNFGTSPTYDWYVNGLLVAHDTTVYTSLYLNGDVVEFKVNSTDGGCYVNDTISAPSVLMVRDSTPATPWLSLISNQLEVNNGGTYIWYYSTTNSYTGTIMPGVVNEVYNPHARGYYYVVKDTGNCPSLPSNIIFISLLEVQNVAVPKANIYPNPTTGILNMDWGGQRADASLGVYNIIGQEILHEEIKGEVSHQTDLSQFPEGNYMVVLRGADGSKETYKVYLQK